MAASPAAHTKERQAAVNSSSGFILYRLASVVVEELDAPPVRASDRQHAAYIALIHAQDQRLLLAPASVKPRVTKCLRELAHSSTGEISTDAAYRRLTSGHIQAY